MPQYVFTEKDIQSLIDEYTPSGDYNDPLDEATYTFAEGLTDGQYEELSDKLTAIYVKLDEEITAIIRKLLADPIEITEDESPSGDPDGGG